VHVRRALLLFAIVLGLAALVTSISRPASEPAREPRPAPATSAPEASPQPESAHAGELHLPGPRGRRSVALRAGEAATLVVAVPEAGQVELFTLGLSSPAEPLTPARFDLLLRQPASYDVTFTPAESGTTRDIGRLLVR
jgi:hypothetical protein